MFKERSSTKQNGIAGFNDFSTTGREVQWNGNIKTLVPSSAN
jgi:hypothetical protein